MYPGHWATIKPNSIACQNTTTDETLTWQQLNDQSNQVAQLLANLGLGTGDHVALLAENSLTYFAIAWGVMRSGMYLTCINRYLTVEEVAYIVNDSGSRALFASANLAATATLPAHLGACDHLFALASRSHAVPSSYHDYHSAVRPLPTTPIAKEPMGDSMLYSSGTTGQPKGIKRPLTGKLITEGIPGVSMANVYGIDDNTRYLSPAPLYHAAPFGFCMRTLCLGGSVYMMEGFDAEASLANIDKYQITHSQWVPTMFVRMLKLPVAQRAQYQLDSHQVAIHAAAPCPVEVKQQMMDWWGPILWEYYAGTERNGTTIIGPHDWLAHPGSVGQANSGIIHICDDAGTDVPTGDTGIVYFEQPERTFEYHNAPEKTSSATHPTQATWTSLGDVGYLDEEGFLFLTDRKAFMIISGGVNIYPQEIEDALIMHPQVRDVAVFGVPNPDFGEAVKAVVEPMSNNVDTEQLAATLQSFAREHLAPYKVPRSIDFVPELPRLPTGKLYKRLLKDQYWQQADNS